MSSPLMVLLLDLNLFGLDSLTIPVIGLGAAGLTFVAGWVVLGRRPGSAARHAGTATTAAAAPFHDPFTLGSCHERRHASRRLGHLTEVLVTEGDATNSPLEGCVLDRSVGGLCLSLPVSADLGTMLRVRPRDASPVVPWVQVEVRSCRQQGSTWEVGVQFVQTPPWSVLMLFG